MNDRIISSRENIPELENLDFFVEYLIEELESMLDYLSSAGELTVLQVSAIGHFTSGNYDQCKETCLLDPFDPALGVLSCLASAKRSPMIADSVLREAAQYLADMSKQIMMQKIKKQFEQHPT